MEKRTKEDIVGMIAALFVLLFPVWIILLYFGIASFGYADFAFWVGTVVLVSFIMLIAWMSDFVSKGGM